MIETFSCDEDCTSFRALKLNSLKMTMSMSNVVQKQCGKLLKKHGQGMYCNLEDCLPQGEAKMLIKGFVMDYKKFYVMVHHKAYW